MKCSYFRCQLFCFDLLFAAIRVAGFSLLFSLSALISLFSESSSGEGIKSV